MTGADRRKSPRKVVDLPVRCVVDGRSFPARLRDICRDAALVEAHEACPLETRIVLALELPGAGAVEVAGRVIRLTDGEGDAHGLAVVFTAATPAAATRIDLFLSRQPA
ncbi:MAG TPA: PilZ domain-containing protein [Vicinamibacteria bacterium]|nr:PilZ domain-containing protein [Vicinamibacteria bacterium]